ncbi:MAG TPA: GTP 3',8-cyclase MoaA [Clostridiales bacterium]|nr:GTP 3',8-cyclase MoaA [Clostridiales bacterium]
MQDQYGRKIEYLRLSITDLCNLRCKYCMPEKGIKKLPHDEILTFEQMVNVAKAAKKLGIKKLRITGGEPLVKRNFIALLESISEIGFEDLGITTNGINLPKYIDDIKRLGVKRINISLDSLNKKTYQLITNHDELDKALLGIDKSIEAGIKVKINTVMLKNINENEFENLINFAKEKNILLRFIELMPTECSKDFAKLHYLSSKDVIKKFNAKFVREEGVADIYDIGGFLVGFISPISNKFCDSCNKIRITSTGLLIPCLHSNVGYSLKPYVDNVDELARQIEKFTLNKPISHFIGEKENISKTMNTIGG